MNQQTNVLKVAGNSQVKAVAGSISKSLESGRNVELVAVGASAINQGVKAIALARSFTSIKGYNLYCAPGFHTVEIEGKEKTAIKFVLKVI